MMLLEVLLILLHDPAGRDVWISSNAVVSLRARGSEEHFQKGANCLVNLDDGKFVAVRENCEAVREKVGERK